MASLSAHVARNVAAERTRQKLKQEELADRLGWSRATVGDLETGRRRLLADDLPVLCRGLGISLSKLLDGVESDDLEALRLG